MAYVIKYDDDYLFDPYVGEDTVTDATITATINASSYFDFTITRDHRLYNTVKERSGIVSVYFESTLLFMGEITSIEEDFYGSKTISCVDPRDQLSNVLLRPYSTVEGEQANLAPSSVDGYFQWLIDQYNDGMINAKFKLDVGVNQGAYLDKNNYIYRENDQFPSVASELEDKILDSLGGYLTLTYPNGSPTLNLYSDVHEANTQIIDFGVNLLDFSKETATSDQYTAIRPVGGTPERDSDDPEPVTLEPLGDGVTSVDSDYIKRGDVVYCLSAVNRYGYKEYNWSEGDTLDPQELLEKAVAELKKNVEPKLTIEVSAVDMALFAEGYDHLECGQVARVRSKPHGIDEYLMVSSVDIDLQDPSQTKYTLGQAFDSLTGEQSSYVKSLNSGINSSLDSVAALDQTVKDQASQIGSVEQIANDAKDTATNAQNTANSAQQAAQDAQNSASSALDKAEAAEGAVSEIQGMIEDINSGAEQAKQDAAQAKADAEEAAAKADAAAEKADSYQQQLTDVTTTVNGVVQEVEGYTAQISGAVQDAEAALTATSTLATDLNGFKTQVNQTYATKDALNQEVLNRQSAIEQTASSITQTVSENYTELKGYSDAAQSTAEEALSAANQANSDLANFTSTVTGDLADLQDQIDGNIATWFYAGTPTLTNEPAVNWSTTEEKNQHLGDLYYDTNNGYAWRFMVQNGSYSWGRITDSDVTKALEDAANAQDTADSKRRVFVSQPTPPYDVGDLWVQGENGDILRCATPRASGSYNASDWVLASKYTDDSALEIFEGQVADIYSTKAELETATDSITATVEENFEKSVLVKEADGGVVDCGDTAGMPLAGLTVYGQTRQNLWVNPTGTRNGITVTENDDGSLTVEGSATAAAIIGKKSYILKPSAKYTAYVDKKIYVDNGFWLEFYNADDQQVGSFEQFGSDNQGMSVTFDVPSDAVYCLMCVAIPVNATVSGTYRIMLNEGTEAQPWCAPGLNSVENVTVWQSGKNLLSIPIGNLPRYTNGITFSDNGDGGIKVVGTATDSAYMNFYTSDIPHNELVLPPGTYTTSLSDANNLVNLNTGAFIYPQSSGSYETIRGKPGTFTLGITRSMRIFLSVATGVTVNTVVYPQLEVGNTATSFEPPSVTSTPIDLLGNKVSSLPDGTRDELTVDAGGNVVLRKNVRNFLCANESMTPGKGTSGSSVYFMHELGTGNYAVTSGNGSGVKDGGIVSDRLIGVSDASYKYNNSVYISNYGKTMYFWDPSYGDTGTEIYEWLSDNEVEINYQYLESKNIPLGAVDLPALPEQNAHVWISTGTQGLDPDIHAIWYAENASALKNFASKAELKVESDQIKATVEETYSTKEEVSAVEDKADAAQDDLDAYKTTVSTTYATKSSVTQTANSIKQEVAAEYTTKEEFEGLEIGGRNLLLESDTPNRLASPTGYPCAEYALSQKVVSGEKYTATISGTFTGAATWAVYFGGGSYGTPWEPVGGDGSKTLSMTFTANSTKAAQTFVCIYVRDSRNTPAFNGSAIINWAKLEKGTKATDWSPAPEDMLSTADASATYATKQSVTTVEQTVDGLKSTVSSNYTTLNNKFGSYYTKTEVDQKDNSIKSTVSSVQTTANNALSKASTVEQTASGLEVRLTQAEKDVDTAQSTANTAKTNAATAQSTANTANSTANTAKTNATTAQNTANAAQDAAEAAQSTANAAKTAAATAQTTATNAAKTATNYLKFDSSGLCVGNMTGTLQGNTLITSDGVKIRNGTTVLASFTASEVQLGGASSSIQFGDYAHVTGSNSGASFGYGSIDGDQGSFLQLKDKEVTLQWPRVGTGGVKVTGLRFHTNTNQSFSGGKLYHQDRYLDGTSGTTYQYFCGRRLYYNASGTTGNVTLVESAANFYFIDIFFMNNDNYRDYVRVYAPNGNSAILSNSVYKNEYTTTYVRNKVVTISGTSISVVSNRNGEGQVKQNNSCYATDSTSVIKIYAVWGWQ